MNTKTKILIVEDEWLIAEITQKTLEKLGYTVASVAVSGEEAIRKAEECKPDLILMDIEPTHKLKNNKSILKNPTKSMS